VNTAPLTVRAASRAPLLSVLRLLVRECGWSPERIFLFGYAHGGTVALDLLQHLDGLAGGGPCRLGGCVSWCGLPLPEAPPPPAGAVVRTPVLAVVGERDPLTPSARELLSRLTSGAAEVARSGGGGGGAVASGAAASRAEGGGAAASGAEEGSVAECTLEVLPGRGGGMVGSANEVGSCDSHSHCPLLTLLSSPLLSSPLLPSFLPSSRSSFRFSRRRLPYIGNSAPLWAPTVRPPLPPPPPLYRKLRPPLGSHRPPSSVYD